MMQAKAQEPEPRLLRCGRRRVPAESGTEAQSRAGAESQLKPSHQGKGPSPNPLLEKGSEIVLAGKPLAWRNWAELLEPGP